MNLAYEEKLLALFFNTSSLKIAKERLFFILGKGFKKEWLLLKQNQSLFTAIAQCINSDVQPSVIQVLEKLRKSKKDISQHQLSISTILSNPIPNTNELPSIIKGIKSYYFQQKLDSISNLLKEIASNPVFEPENAIAQTQESLRELLSEVVPQGDEGEDLSEIMTNYLNDLFSDVSTPIYDTGLTDLDHHLQFCPQTLNILAGRPSMGKTAIAMYLLFTIAFRHHKPCYVFSLEMSKEQLVERFLTMFSHSRYFRDHDIYPTTSWRINQHKLSKLPSSQHSIDSKPLTENEKNNLWLINSLVEHLGNDQDSYLGICDSRQITPAQIEMKCREYMSKKQVNSLGLVVIDYVQELAKGTSDNSAQRSNEIGSIVRQLRDISQRINSPILLLAQLNRGVETRTDKRPLMSDLADSGAIEQSADTITFMYRDEYYNLNSPDKNIAEVFSIH